MIKRKVILDSVPKGNAIHRRRQTYRLLLQWGIDFSQSDLEEVELCSKLPPSTPGSPAINKPGKEPLIAS